MTKNQNGSEKKSNGKNEKILLVIVVNGTSVHVNADPTQLLSSLIEPALKKANVADNSDPSRWVFKDENGNVLEKEKLIGSFGFTDKKTIFLSLEAGVAG